MKTAEEVAAGILSSQISCHDEMCAADYDNCECRPGLIAILTAFAEERVKEEMVLKGGAIGRALNENYAVNCQRIYAQGFSDARERAAKMMDFAAKETMMCGTVECQFYAKEIRALQPSEKGEEKND